VRILYVALMYALAPLLMAYEAWTAWRRDEPRRRVVQRLGYAVPVVRPGSVWVHAVSVGEVQAAAALVHELRRRHPGWPVVVTTVTATGAARARAVFGESVQYAYLPYDLPGAVHRFLDAIAPRVAVILETELWPTLYRQLARRRVPVVLASARLSERSVRRYRRVPGLVRATLAHHVHVCAQTEADASRFVAIGAPPGRVRVTGNVKYDIDIPETVVAAGRALRASWNADRPVWIAGSTHDGEEQAALAAHDRVRARHPTALLLLVPRHPRRFEAVAQWLRSTGVAYARRSTGTSPAATDTVYLADSVGELQSLYAASDVAFVGGSLVPVGGHSLLEPALLGLPALSGPHVHNAPDVAGLLERAGGLHIVHDAAELADGVLRWFDDRAAARVAGEAGRGAVAANRGAVARVAAAVEPLLTAPDAP
jgi:3-deoxy-D-manno-octulosonic-acid transferase